MVPVKEGTPRQVSDLDTLLQERHKLILLDDNLLAHPSAMEEKPRKFLVMGAEVSEQIGVSLKSR